MIPQQLYEYLREITPNGFRASPLAERIEIVIVTTVPFPDGWVAYSSFPLVICLFTIFLLIPLLRIIKPP